MRPRLSHYSTFLFAAALSCTATASPSPQAPQPAGPAIRVGVNLVRVPTRVVDAQGQPVRNLRVGDFQVLENGKEQKISIFEDGMEPVHVALIVDTSGSTTPHLDDLVDAARDFATRFAKDDRLTLYEAGPEVVRLQGYTADRGALRDALDKVKTASGRESISGKGLPGRLILKHSTGRGGTLLYDAILAVKREFPVQASRRVIILFTDGWDSGSDAEFQLVHNAVLWGNEQVFTLLVKNPAPPVIEESLSSPRREAQAPQTWAVIFDTLVASGEAVVRMEAVARAFLEQLPEQDRVWLFTFEGGLRPVVTPPAKLHTDGTLLPISADEAKSALTQVRAAAADRAKTGASNLRIDPDRVLFIADGSPISVQQFMQKARPRRGAMSVVMADLFTGEADLRAAMQTLVHDPDGAAKVRVQQEFAYRARVESQMPQLAADSGGETFELARKRDLSRIYRQIAEQIRSSYTLGYYTLGRAGRHQLQVSVRGRDLQVRARRAVLVN